MPRKLQSLFFQSFKEQKIVYSFAEITDRRQFSVPFSEGSLGRKETPEFQWSPEKMHILTSNQGNANWKDNWVPFHSENICTSKMEQITGRAPHWRTLGEFRPGPPLWAAVFGHRRSAPRQVGVTPQVLLAVWGHVFGPGPSGRGPTGSGTAGPPAPRGMAHSPESSDPSAQESWWRSTASGAPHTCMKIMDMDIKHAVQRCRYMSRKEMTLFQEIK